MFETFYPGNYVDSAYEIPYEKLYERGYRGIIFDVDNTLVPHGAPADARAIELFERLRAIGFSTCILSNNKEPRVSPFADKVGSPYIFKGGKPSRKGYERAMERMKTDRDTTLFVGDQLFTDLPSYPEKRNILIYPVLTNGYQQETNKTDCLIFCRT